MIHKPLFLLPPEAAHTVAMTGLSFLSRCPGVCRRLRGRVPSLPVSAAGLSLDNPIGLAAGLDKDAIAVEALFALGFGAVEVGTVTLRPQPGNPRPRVFRRPAERALVNRLGFPSDGAEAVAARLARVRFRPGPLGVNIGKNLDTPLDEAVADYRACAATLGPHADYLVVNASSPNTPGLRRLQEPERLAAVLDAVRGDKPVFVKIAPELAPEELDALVDAAAAAGATGIIATNTTAVTAPEAGGLSGPPLRSLAIDVVRRVHRRAAGRLTVVGVGGVATPEDAYAMIRAGASFVQVYTGFIYEGPGLVRRLVAGLARLLARDGLATVGDAVGRDN